MYKTEYQNVSYAQKNGEQEPFKAVKTIGLIHSSKTSAETIREMMGSFEQRGYRVLAIETGDHPEKSLDRLSAEIDFFFFYIPEPDHYLDNLLLPLLCEKRNIPYAGSDPLTQALAMHKHISKMLAVQMGIPTAAWHFIQDDADLKQLPADGKKKIIKPVFGTFSKGISISSDDREIRNAIVTIREEHKQAAIVEDFIEGYEITVPVLGNSSPGALTPISTLMNQDFLLKDVISTTSMKQGFVPQRSWAVNPFIAPNTVHLLKEWSETMHKTLGCKGFSRVDFRISEAGQAYFLEINTLPGISKEGPFFIAVQESEPDYSTFLHRIIQAV